MINNSLSLTPAATVSTLIKVCLSTTDHRPPRPVHNSLRLITTNPICRPGHVVQWRTTIIIERGWSVGWSSTNIICSSFSDKSIMKLISSDCILQFVLCVACVLLFWQLQMMTGIVTDYNKFSLLSILLFVKFLMSFFLLLLLLFFHLLPRQLRYLFPTRQILLLLDELFE